VTTIIIEGEEAYATGCARLGQLLRYSFAGCCRGASVGGTRSKEERRTRLREGVWSAVPTERGGCGFAMFSKGSPAVFDVTGNGAPPHSLWTPNRRDYPSGSPLSKFGPFCNGCNGFWSYFPPSTTALRSQTPLDVKRSYPYNDLHAHSSLANTLQEAFQGPLAHRGEPRDRPPLPATRELELGHSRGVVLRVLLEVMSHSCPSRSRRPPAAYCEQVAGTHTQTPICRACAP
jgi:hypothetical protein